jgi:hypothetical protein
VSDEYPKRLYRPGTKFRVWGISVDALTVRDADEEAAALAEGWTLRPDGEPEAGGTDKPQLDHDKDGGAGGSVTAPGDLTALRAEYKRVLGKKPFNGWDADTLKAKIEEAK